MASIGVKPNSIYLGDAFELIKQIPDSFVDLILTDPPYFLDKLDSSWNPENIRKAPVSRVVKHLPGGMRFDPEQGRRLQKWYYDISVELFRVLKPGGFFFSFASPRLVHRVMIAVEEAGFYIRDLFIWLYTGGAAKAFSLNHFLQKEIQDNNKNSEILVQLSNWKTPQVRANYEPIVVAQKPPEGRLLDNFLKYGVGLFNFEEKLEGGYAPSNVLQTELIEGLPYANPIFMIKKPSVKEKGPAVQHPTVKPIQLLSHLIRLTSKPSAIVLDPFLGSGSTAIAAKLENRQYIGFEINKEYFDIAQDRLQSIDNILQS